MASPRGLASSQYSGLRVVKLFIWQLRVPNMSVSGGKKRQNLHPIYDLTLECLSYSILVKTVISLSKLEVGGVDRITLHVLMGEHQDHIVEEHV